MSEDLKFPTAACRLCGRAIVWGVTADGKKIPLDPSAPVYSTRAAGELVSCERLRPGESVTGAPMAVFVSHFATCTKVGDLKKGETK